MTSVKGCKFSVIRRMSSEALMYSKVPLVNDRVSCTHKLRVGLKHSHHTHTHTHKHTHKSLHEVLDVLIISILVILPQCICISNHHVYTLNIHNYIRQLVLSKGKSKTKRCVLLFPF